MQIPSIEKIALGTAQFGGAYGINNGFGIPPEVQIHGILRKAIDVGIRSFDTAAAYGNCEHLLGTVVQKFVSPSEVRITTKGTVLGEGIVSTVEASMSRLCVPCLDSWLLHCEGELDSWDSKTWAGARKLTESGKVRSFGVSAYQPAAAVRGLKEIGLETVQFPGSPMDRRFFRHQELSELLRNGKQATVRSIYLQGLCLVSQDAKIDHIPYAREAVTKLDGFCRAHGLQRDAFCLQYVLCRIQGLNANIVVGLETIDQLERNISILQSAPLPVEICDEWDAVWPDDHETLVLPYLWK